MAIERRPSKTGKPSYRVKYPGPNGEQLSRTFLKAADAKSFDATWRVERQRDAARFHASMSDPDAGKITLSRYVAEWLPTWEVDKFEVGVRERRRIFNNVVAPRLGGYQLRELRPKVIQQFMDSLTSDGVGVETARKAFEMLGQMFDAAVIAEEIESNPCGPVRRRPQKRARPVEVERRETQTGVLPGESAAPRVLSEEDASEHGEVDPLLVPSLMDVEMLRKAFIERSDPRSALLVSILGHAGLRPGEAMALRPGDCSGGVITVRARVSGTKVIDSAKSPRSPVRQVEMPAQLQDDLEEWGALCPARDFLIPAERSPFWTTNIYRVWQQWTYQPVAADLKLSPRPYALRHSHASMLFACGSSLAEVAKQLGHTIEMASRTYVHVVNAIEVERRLEIARIERLRKEGKRVRLTAPKTLNERTEEARRLAGGRALSDASKFARPANARSAAMSARRRARRQEKNG